MSLGFYLKESLLLLKILCHVISASDKTDKLSIFADLNKVCFLSKRPAYCRLLVTDTLRL